MATMYVETYRPTFPETGVKIKVHKAKDYSRDVLSACMTSVWEVNGVKTKEDAIACVIEKAAGNYCKEDILMVDFWEIHNWVFILCMFFFPRLTMLFATTAGGGLLYWLGWIFAPRLTVAILATYYFGHTNTALVVFTWIWAFSGEAIEKQGASQVSRRT